MASLITYVLKRWSKFERQIIHRNATCDDNYRRCLFGVDSRFCQQTPRRGQRVGCTVEVNFCGGVATAKGFPAVGVEQHLVFEMITGPSPSLSERILRSRAGRIESADGPA